MVPLVVVVGMIMNVDVVVIVIVVVVDDVIVMTVSQSRCTLLVQCLYCICDTCSYLGLEITFCYSPFLHVYE